MREAVPDVVGVAVGDDREHQRRGVIPDRVEVLRRRLRWSTTGGTRPAVSATSALATRPASAISISPVIEHDSWASQATTGATSSGPIGGYADVSIPSAILVTAAGHDDVARHPVRGTLERGDVGQPDHAGLGDGVVRHVVVAVQARRSTTSARCGRNRRRTSPETRAARRETRRAGGRRAPRRSRRSSSPSASRGERCPRCGSARRARRSRSAPRRRSPARLRRWRPIRCWRRLLPPAARISADHLLGGSGVGAVAGEAAADVVDHDLGSARCQQQRVLATQPAARRR